MMRVKFTFGWGAKLTPAVLEQVAEVCGVQKMELRDATTEPDENGLVELASYAAYEADLAVLLPLLPAAMSLDVQGLAAARPLQQIQETLDRLLVLAAGPVRADPAEYVNTKVDVHVPGAALLAIDEVMVAEDSCTDALASFLDQGWRIIAACPQPDQRRPDYVLGRRAAGGL